MVFWYAFFRFHCICVYVYVCTSRTPSFKSQWIFKTMQTNIILWFELLLLLLPFTAYTALRLHSLNIVWKLLWLKIKPRTTLIISSFFVSFSSSRLLASEISSASHFLSVLSMKIFQTSARDRDRESILSKIFVRHENVCNFMVDFMRFWMPFQPHKGQ